MVTGNCLLQGVDAPSCQPNLSLQDARQRPGPKKLQRLPRLVCPLDYYPLLVFHVDSNDITRDILENIMCDYGALWERMKGVAAHVVFFSPCSERERIGRNELILQVNK